MDHVRGPADGVPECAAGRGAGTVLLPSLAKHHSDANHAEYSSLIDWGLRLAFLLALPAAVALWLLALPLITTLYQYGKFNVNDVWQTREALLGYSVGPARHSSSSRSWRPGSMRAKTCGHRCGSRSSPYSSRRRWR